jgi:hypothetical protein
MGELVTTNQIKEAEYVDVSLDRSSGKGGLEIDLMALKVHELPATIKRITTTEEGAIQIVFESKILDADHLRKARELLGLQRSGNVLVSIEPIQQDLFDA